MLLSFIALLILILNLPYTRNLSLSEPFAKEVDELESEQQLKIQDWKAQLLVETFNKKSAIFADSLAEMYFEYQKYDSSAKYFEIAVELEPTTERKERWAEAVNEYKETD